MEKLFAIAAIMLLATACQSQPQPDSAPAEQGEQADDTNAADDDNEAPDGADDPRVDENDKKINDRNALDDDPKCPPAADPDPDTMCAQVIVYGLTEDGVCCQYPNPCVVPDAIVEEFSSLDDCENSAESME